MSERTKTGPTPGPWSADPGMTIGAVVAHVDRPVKTPLVIRAATCNMDMTTAEMDAEAAANARLIAAAPTMYEALRAVAEFLAEIEGRDEIALGEQVFAALRKAEGGEG